MVGTTLAGAATVTRPVPNPHRGLGDQLGGAGHPPRAGHDQQHARCPLVRVGLPCGKHGRHVGWLDQECVRAHQPAGEPDVDDPERAGQFRPGKQHRADLRGAERDREIGARPPRPTRPR